VIPTAFLGTIKDGKPVPDDVQTFNRANRLMERRRVKIAVTPWFPKMPKQAFGYYWGVVIVFWCKRFHEENPKFMHEVLMTLYSFRMAQVGDEMIRVPKRLSRMDSKEGGIHIDKCLKGFSEQYGFEIPPPTSVVSQQMIEEYSKFGNANERMD